MGIFDIFKNRTKQQKQTFHLDESNVYDICYALSFILSGNCFSANNFILINADREKVTISGCIDSDNCYNARKANNISLLYGIRAAREIAPEVNNLAIKLDYSFSDKGTLTFKKDISVLEFQLDECRLRETIDGALSVSYPQQKYKIHFYGTDRAMIDFFEQ